MRNRERLVGESASSQDEHRWPALGEDSVRAGEQWLSPGEAASLAGLRFTKRRTEFLVRRLVTKHAVAAVIGRPTGCAGQHRGL
jgi:hypothetical protein